MSLTPPTGLKGRTLAVLLVGLLLIAIWFAAVGPMLGWYNSRAAALAQQGLQLHRMQALAAQLPVLEKATNQTGRAPAPDQFLSGSTDAIAGGALEQQVQAMVSQNGATLSTAEVLSPLAEGLFQRIQLRVTITSSWPELVRLLAMITTSEPTMLVDNLQLSAAQFQEQTGDPPINATFTVVAFRDGSDHPVGSGIEAEPFITP